MIPCFFKLFDAPPAVNVCPFWHLLHCADGGENIWCIPESVYLISHKPAAWAFGLICSLWTVSDKLIRITCRWHPGGGARRLTWLTIACTINADLHRCMLTETDYAWDHLFRRISLQIEQSIYHMQTHLTPHQSTQLTKTQSFLWSLVSSEYWNRAFNFAKLQNLSQAACSCCAVLLLYDRWSLCEASASIIKSILLQMSCISYNNKIIM